MQQALLGLPRDGPQGGCALHARRDHVSVVHLETGRGLRRRLHSLVKLL